jgi:hypothetical protein
MRSRHKRCPEHCVHCTSSVEKRFSIHCRDFLPQRFYSCYSSNGYIEVLARICSENGLILRRYDYSEPQKGKDQADPEGAVSKAFANAFIQNGGSVRCAGDLKKAILFNGGPRSTKVAVAKNPKSENSQIQDFQKIPNISYFYSAELKENCCTFWKHYNIGKGVKVSWGDVKFQATIQVSDDFDNGQTQILPMARKQDRKMPQFCSVPDCEAGFIDQKDLDNHMRAGKHGKARERNNNTVIFQYYSQHALASVYDYSVLDVEEGQSSHDDFPRGWALNVRKSRRFDNDVKSFVTKEFLNGELSKQKMSAEAIFHKIRTEKAANGSNLFDSSQYLTTKQIKGLISRLTKMYREGKISLNDVNNGNLNSETLG